MEDALKKGWMDYERSGRDEKAADDAERAAKTEDDRVKAQQSKGEASLRGHLKAEGDEQTGSQSYIPPDPKDDKALHTALDLIRGITKNSAYPPNSKTTPVPN